MSTKNKDTPQFSLTCYKLTVVEDAQDQRTAVYTMPTNLREEEELLSKSKKYINHWVTTVIRGWRNMSPLWWQMEEDVCTKLGKGGTCSWSKQTHTTGWQAQKTEDALSRIEIYLDCRDFNKAIPRDQSSLPMPDILLKTYLIICADSTKADNQLSEPGSLVKKKQTKYQNQNVFPSIYFWQSNHLTKHCYIGAKKIVKALPAFTWYHVMVISGRDWSWRWPQSKQKILRSLQIKSSLWQKMIGQSLFSVRTQPRKVKPL